MLVRYGVATIFATVKCDVELIVGGMIANRSGGLIRPSMQRKDFATTVSDGSL